MAEYLCEEDMNTGEYISRDEALKAMQYCCESCDNYNGVMCRACDNADEMDIIIDMPAADAQPIRRGKWREAMKKGEIKSIFYCSCCDNEAYWDTDFGQQFFEYCPYCGADMRDVPDTDVGEISNVVEFKKRMEREKHGSPD